MSNLPDDIYSKARALAASRGISVGDALAELARRGFEATEPVDTHKPFPCFRLPANARPITLERTLATEDEIGSRLALLEAITALPENQFWPDNLPLRAAIEAGGTVVTHCEIVKCDPWCSVASWYMRRSLEDKNGL